MLDGKKMVAKVPSVANPMKPTVRMGLEDRVSQVSLLEQRKHAKARQKAAQNILQSCFNGQTEGKVLTSWVRRGSMIGSLAVGVGLLAMHLYPCKALARRAASKAVMGWPRTM